MDLFPDLFPLRSRSVAGAGEWTPGLLSEELDPRQQQGFGSASKVQTSPVPAAPITEHQAWGEDLYWTGQSQQEERALPVPTIPTAAAGVGLARIISHRQSSCSSTYAMDRNGSQWIAMDCPTQRILVEAVGPGPSSIRSGAAVSTNRYPYPFTHALGSLAITMNCDPPHRIPIGSLLHPRRGGWAKCKHF